jgi:drug/metabolite transporter (DMT)-like permease
VLLVVGAALAWSSGGILLRLVTEASGFAQVFWRSLFMALAVGLWLLARHRRGAIGAVRAVGWPGCLSACLLAGAFIGYVLAINETAVANTMVIMSASPLIAALLAWMVLGERLTLRTTVAIAVAFAGIAVMFGDELGRGHAVGNGLALLVAVCFGANVVVLRRYRAVDMVPVMLLAGLLSAALAFPFAAAFTVPWRDVGILAVMGWFQLALGLFLFIRGTPYLSAAELGLLGLLETVCAPLWVWIGIGEEPSQTALVGGALVLIAVAAQALSGRPSAARAAAVQGIVAPSAAPSSPAAAGGGAAGASAAVSGQASGSLTRQ